MPDYEKWSAERASQLVAQHRGQGAMLPILHAFQETFGHIPEVSVPLIAEALNLSRAEVHGVITFYHDFRSELPGRHIVKICRAEACQAAGGEALAYYAEQKFGVAFGATSPDRQVTLDQVYCLGL